MKNHPFPLALAAVLLAGAALSCCSGKTAAALGDGVAADSLPPVFIYLDEKHNMSVVPFEHEEYLDSLPGIPDLYGLVKRNTDKYTRLITCLGKVIDVKYTGTVDNKNYSMRMDGKPSDGLNYTLANAGDTAQMVNQDWNNTLHVLVTPDFLAAHKKLDVQEIMEMENPKAFAPTIKKLEAAYGQKVKNYMPRAIIDGRYWYGAAEFEPRGDSVLIADVLTCGDTVYHKATNISKEEYSYMGETYTGYLVEAAFETSSGLWLCCTDIGDGAVIAGYITLDDGKLDVKQLVRYAFGDYGDEIEENEEEEPQGEAPFSAEQLKEMNSTYWLATEGNGKTTTEEGNRGKFVKYSLINLDDGSDGAIWLRKADNRYQAIFRLVGDSPQLLAYSSKGLTMKVWQRLVSVTGSRHGRKIEEYHIYYGNGKWSLIRLRDDDTYEEDGEDIFSNAAQANIEERQETPIRADEQEWHDIE